MGEIEEKFPAQWALDLLEPTALDRSNHIFRFYLVPISSAAFTLAVVTKNYMSKLPLTANKPYMLLLSITGAFFGYGCHWASDIRFARRDEMMRDYIRRHPERFPEPEVKKYGDIFQEWYPKR
ncbi:NADH dehydrogenase [ubiquinone] 1 subunit C2 isoform X2 [Bombus pascuorum]|uniref:NADH dehydrogenase [ubiquinone] 1 subunit C2 isoform X2 n=1 Tax=Bombus pascuorum TaxID=65598 RepID=UPI0021412DD8|nr:NADH dehydrogenase [ubiquinone] 1 subunit C2 isoform X2 [Bombus pascuorum]